MGIYINPEDRTKEEFLVPYFPGIQEPIMPTDDSLALVCWVDNGQFTAAGIVTDQRELDAFTEPDDNRPKLWFVVPKEELYKVSPLKPEHFGVNNDF